MKKIIIYITIASLLNLVGCYYQQQMVPAEYNFKDKDDITVTTTDTVYTLKSDEYYYNNDTLFASVTKPLDDKTNLRYFIGIPVNKIETIETKRIDNLNTTITLGVIALLAAGLVFLLSTGGTFGATSLK